MKNINLLKNLKVNLHLTKECNYKCGYCFADFKHNENLSLNEWKIIINNLKASGMVSEVNFAGGEPLLYPGFWELADYAKHGHLKVSVISNGSLFNDKFIIRRMIPCIDMFGFSIDSFNNGILARLGRQCNKKIFSFDDFNSAVSVLRNFNNDIKIKVNTVVSLFNKDEYLAEYMNGVDRWKIFKVKFFKSKSYSNKEFLISDEDFNQFLYKNKVNVPKSLQIITEKSMVSSYIIVDNRGNVLDNYNDNYVIIGNLLKESFDDIMERYNFDLKLYNDRY